jgi:hypothetical protein
MWYQLSRQTTTGPTKGALPWRSILYQRRRKSSNLTSRPSKVIYRRWSATVSRLLSTRCWMLRPTGCARPTSTHGRLTPAQPPAPTAKRRSAKPHLGCHGAHRKCIPDFGFGHHGDHSPDALIFFPPGPCRA